MHECVFSKDSEVCLNKPCPAEVVIDFDPNMVLCGRMVTQTVWLVFGTRTYRKTFEVEISGNCTGLDVIEAAIDQVFEDILDIDNEHVWLEFENDEGSLWVDLIDSDELKKYLISASIIGYVKEEE